MPIGLVEIMKTTPQAVTERYANNLLRAGRNKDYDIASIQRNIAFADEDRDLIVGVYFTCVIVRPTDLGSKLAAGASPLQAVRRCLEKHGVTFR